MRRIVDTREPWPLRELLLATGWEQSALQCGDYAIVTASLERVGITRKRTGDLLNSMGEVLSRHLEDMLASYDICVFLHEVDDSVTYNLETDELQVVLHDKVISRNRLAVANYLHRWYAKGFTAERTAGLEATAKRLNELYALYQKPYSRSALTRKFADDRVLALPSGLRGKNGEKLLEGRSLFELASLSIPDLRELEGIGDKNAYKLYQWFHRR